MEKIELDFNMDPAERLKQEINFTDDLNQKVIGEFLLNEFEKDSVLKGDYKDKKITLDKILAFVIKTAQTRQNTQNNKNCVVMSDKEVFGLVIHYIQDGDVVVDKDDKYVLTKEEKKSLEEQAKEEYLAEQKRKLEEAEQKRIEKEKAKLEKEKKAREESGQMSLFEFGE